MKATKIKVNKQSARITSQMLKELRQEINQALKEIANNHNINIDCGNCSYDDNEATYKLKINAKNNEGQLITKEYNNLLDLSKSDINGFNINGIYTLQGKKVSLEGYSYRSPKYPVHVLDLESGKKYKASNSWFDRVVRKVICKDEPLFNEY